MNLEAIIRKIEEEEDITAWRADYAVAFPFEPWLDEELGQEEDEGGEG